ncbi:MAG: hybrid sensor histidine kinase/response regulator [Nitrospirae bacterium]|nr:hybrid sensor histidine kinase/response regulator [Nitrospirota bacterium]MBF0541729.1 hybrid sensor histidine kinase/response regulator [Nitrospirota bacterium]
MNKILIVDDDRSVQNSISAVICSKGYQSISAFDGEEAIRLFETEQPDTILLDINMPGMNGIEVLKYIKNIDADIPVIMITANYSISTAVETLTHGAYDFLTKPADINKLLITVKNSCANYEVIKQNKKLLIQQSKMAAMGEMIGAIAHQWRQPLNAINLIAQDLVSAFDYGELNREYLGNSVMDIVKQVTFMSNTIDDFRNFFKQDKEKILFKINSIIKEVIYLLYEQIVKSNISISLSCTYAGAVKLNTNCEKNEICTCSPELSAFGYPNEFKQAVLNILTNARDAIIDKQKNSLYLDDESPFINIVISSDNGRAIIKFIDNGGGIPKELIENIFASYVTSKKEGTGIGLYMSKVIIEKNMGGILSAVNFEKGAMFTIELDIAGSVV